MNREEYYRQQTEHVVNAFVRERNRAFDEMHRAHLLREGAFRIRPDCRLCSGAIVEVLHLPDTPLANEYPVAPFDGGQDTFPLYLAQCVECGHVQLPVVVDPERLFRQYAYQSGTSAVFREHLRSFAEQVRPKRGAFVVEIGSNDGTLLGEYRQRGFRVLGVDPARNLVEAARERGVDTIAEFFTADLARDILAKHGPADLIIANNVFAHADDLGSIADGVKVLLAPGGEFVFEVSYLPDVIERGLYRVIYHEHLSYHTINPLHRFFAARGLALQRGARVRVPTQGGSVRLVAGHATIPGFVPIEPEAVGDVTTLAACIARDRERIHSTLSLLRAAGKTVCGYGAPAQLTTTMYALGLTGEHVSFIVDDNPLKIGRCTPGTFIPIVSAAEIERADACVIFSANFADDIKARHADYRGEWIEI